MSNNDSFKMPTDHLRADIEYFDVLCECHVKERLCYHTYREMLEVANQSDCREENIRDIKVTSIVSEFAVDLSDIEKIEKLLVANTDLDIIGIHLMTGVKTFSEFLDCLESLEGVYGKTAEELVYEWLEARNIPRDVADYIDKDMFTDDMVRSGYYIEHYALFYPCIS